MTDFSGGMSDPRSQEFVADRRFVGMTICERGPNGEVISKVTNFSEGFAHYQEVLDREAELNQVALDRDREADLERRLRRGRHEGETAVDAHLRIQEARGYSVAVQFANVSTEQGEDV